MHEDSVNSLVQLAAYKRRVMAGTSLYIAECGERRLGRQTGPSYSGSHKRRSVTIILSSLRVCSQSRTVRLTLPNTVIPATEERTGWREGALRQLVRALPSHPFIQDIFTEPTMYQAQLEGWGPTHPSSNVGRETGRQVRQHVW